MKIVNVLPRFERYAIYILENGTERPKIELRCLDCGTYVYRGGDVNFGSLVERVETHENNSSQAH